jgi:hypothetical protein
MRNIKDELESVFMRVLIMPLIKNFEPILRELESNLLLGLTLQTIMASLRNLTLVGALLLFCTANINAQKKDKKLDNESVDIVRDYKPKILDASKIEVVPEPEKLEVKKPEMKYSSPAALFVTSPYKSAFRTLQTTKTELELLDHAWIKAGFGNYNNIIAEGFYNTIYNKTDLYTAHVKYHSGIGPVKNSQFSDLLADFSGKKIIGKNIFSGDINFQNQMLHYYGYNNDSTKNIDASTLKQNFGDFNISAGLEHAMADTGKLKYSLGLTYNNFRDNFKAMESDISIKGQAIEPFHANSIVFDAQFDYLDYKLLKDYSRNIVKIDVNYKFDLNGFRGVAGFKTANETDSGSSIFHVYPNIELEGNLMDKNLVAFAGVTGGLQKNTFKSFAMENPYINSVIDLRNTNNKLSVFGGFKGSISSNAFYLISASFESYKNMYFYINDSFDAKRFLPVYDDNTKLLRLHAEAGTEVTDKLNIAGAINYYNYTLSNPVLLKPYHLPAIDFRISVKYMIENKIIIGADIYAMDKRYALVKETLLIPSFTKTLDPIFDLNLNGTYRQSDLLGIFVEFRNLLNRQYMLWNNYAVRGLQVIGGVKVSF